MDPLARRHAVLEHWYVMLVEFTNRRLSNPHGIFASVSSLAQAAARLMGGCRYLAGIWEADVIRGLLWRPSYYGTGPPYCLDRSRLHLHLGRDRSDVRRHGAILTTSPMRANRA